MFHLNRDRIKYILKSTQYYILCLVPATLLNFNVNYLFLLSHGARNQKFPKDRVLKIFIPYIFVCYVLGLFTTVPLGNNAVLRQLISFGAFFVVCSVIFISYTKEDIYKLMYAAVYVSVLYSLWVIIVAILVNPGFDDQIKWDLRPYVWAWPQYFMPILIFALIFLLTRKNKKFLHYLGILIIVICVFISRSRTVYIIFPISISFFVGVTCINYCRQKEYKKLLIYISSILILGTVLYFIIRYSQIAITRILIDQINRAYNYIQSIFSNELDQSPTVSVRLFQWQLVLEFLFSHNPITGAGFAGIYLLPNAVEQEYTFSIDGQFLETTLKMGFVGSAFFIYFYWKLVKFYHKIDLGICTGIISFIVYGATHTTYLSPFNGFLFFALLSYADSQTDTIINT